MATRPKARPAPARADADDTTQLIQEGLAQVRTSLLSVNAKLTQVVDSLAAQAAGIGAQAQDGVGQTVNSWEDDPFSEGTPTVNPPAAATTTLVVAANVNPKLQAVIFEPKPPLARHQPGTLAFRYWVAAETLARGINFWGALLPAGTTWSTHNPMRVKLVEPGHQLNANYTRANGLRFYRASLPGREIFSCESPDVVCHELGHAILDALRPQLFHTASTETGAFHEAFGDISAILCALQISSIRRKVVAETGGRLNSSSRLSRVAEQLGWGIRQTKPTAVDRDALRNAANRFFYRRPDLLPPWAPASQLSTAVHSFSRVFTGAFLDALAGMVAENGAADEANLLETSQHMGQIIVDGVHSAPIATAYFSQVAAAIVKAGEVRFGAKYGPALTRAFMRRGILSVSSTMQLIDADGPAAMAASSGAAEMIAPEMGAPTILAYGDGPPDDAYRLGLGETPDLPLRTATIGAGVTVEVHAPEEPPRFAVAAAAFGAQPSDALEGDTATNLFLEGLIQRGEIEIEAAGGRSVEPALAALASQAPREDPSRVTHALVREGGKLVLKRERFNCFCCPGPTAPARLACR